MKSEKPFQLPPAHQTFGKGQLERVGPFCIYIFLIQVQFELEYDKPRIASEH
jgi:hypothetical protein